MFIETKFKSQKKYYALKNNKIKFYIASIFDNFC